MAQTKTKMTLALTLMTVFCALSSVQGQAPLPPLGQLPPPTTQTPPVQLPPVGQLPPPVPLPPPVQLAPPVQLPPVGQLPPPANQTPPVQTPTAQSCNPSSAVTSLAPCVGYLIGNTSAPSTACCSLVTTLVSSQKPCLCSMLQTGLTGLTGLIPLGSVFNQTQALSLPSVCNMATNPCTEAASPSAEPAAPSVPTAASPSTDAPAAPSTAKPPAAAATPPVSKVPSGSGKAVPTTVSTAARSSTDSAPALFIPLFVASYLMIIKGF